MKLEVGAPLNFNPDWPVRTTEAYPKSVAPLIVPAFDTGTPSPYSFLTPETPADVYKRQSLHSEAPRFENHRKKEWPRLGSFRK